MRHADKAEARNGNENVPLTRKLGMEQAKRLRSVLADIPLTAIYTTNACRTVQTVLPTAQAREEMEITVFDGKNYTDFSDCPDEWNSRLLIKNHDKAKSARYDNRRSLQMDLTGKAEDYSLLIADHSDFVCSWMEKLIGPKKPSLTAEGKQCYDHACPQTVLFGEIFRFRRATPWSDWTLSCQLSFE